MPVKVLYIISDVEKAPCFEWINDFFSDDPTIKICFCFLSPNPPETASIIQSRRGSVSVISMRGKKDWPSAFWRLLKLLCRYNPDVTHCHLQAASILGLSASFLTGIKRRIYTRHHGSIHHNYQKKGLAWDYLCNTLATEIVSISPSIFTILSQWECVSESKIVNIPHGFPLDNFGNSSIEQVHSFASRYDIPIDKRIIGVVSRFVEWKGVEYIIDAFKSLLANRIDIHLLLMNAIGPHSHSIHRALSSLPVSAWTAIPFDPDISSAYKLMDVFVHAPIDAYSEAFGQVYVEALASGVPMVCTLSGIAPVFVRNGYNALTVPFRDSNAIENALGILLDNDDLRNAFVVNCRKGVRSFSLNQMCDRLRLLYLGRPVI